MLFGATIGLLALELAKIKKNVVNMDEELGTVTRDDSTTFDREEEKE